MKLIAQTLALIHKNLLLYGLRRLPTTIFRAILLPIAFIILLAELKNIGTESGPWGVNSARSIKSLGGALLPSKKVVLVTNNLGSLADSAAKLISDPLKSAGHHVTTIQNPSDLLLECPATLGGKTSCLAAVVFNEAKEKSWNYTLRFDDGLSWGSTFSSNSGDNAVQNIILPVQNAVDAAISSASKQSSAASQMPNTKEMGFNDRTEKQRVDDQRVTYMGIITGFLAIAFVFAGLGIVYHLVGAIATEREKGMSLLLEASGCGVLARVLSYHLSFTLIYLPGWLLVAILTKTMIFTKTSFGVVLVGELVFMLSLTSMSCFGASLFRKAQISGILVSFISAAMSILGMYFATLDGGERLPFNILAIVFPPGALLYYNVWIATFESANLGATLGSTGPTGFDKGHAHTLSGGILLLLGIAHIIVFFALAILVEKLRFGTGDKRRVQGTAPGNMVELENFCKTYKGKSRCFCCSGRSKDVKAVKDLSLSVSQGEILTLLGANGSGKSTTLEAISGLGNITSGKIRLKEGESLGFCPQKNVLWDDLTCSEHVRIFNRVKGCKDDFGTLHSLIRDCDLAKKTFAASKTLSGGQKRKLQLALMLTGDTRICAIDEVSSGVDPLSRRKLHDIILAERGKRTMIVTTHFLDEADLLADRVAIMSKGDLKAYGSSAELKTRYGGGYKVHADDKVYNVGSAEEASLALDELVHSGVEASVHGPTLEEVFLKLAEDANAAEEFEEKQGAKKSKKNKKNDKPFTPLNEDGLRGRKVSAPQQIWVMFRKRWTILRRSSKFATFVMCIIPIAAAFIARSQISDYKVSSCATADKTQSDDDFVNLLTIANPRDAGSLVIGPKSAITDNAQKKLFSIMSKDHFLDDTENKGPLRFTAVESAADFESYIASHPGNVSYGFFIDPSKKTNEIAYQAPWTAAGQALNALNNLLLPSDTFIYTYTGSFGTPGGQGLGNSLLFIMYFGLALAVYPAFFGLYPTVERIRNVRALHYSNGIRAMPLWLGYILFDFIFILIINVVSLIFIAGATNWNNIFAVGVIFILYGLVATAMSYLVSMTIAKSQLASFAIVALYQVIGHIVTNVAFLSISLTAGIGEVNSKADAAHFIIALFMPIASVVRSLFVGLNTQSMTCIEGSKAIPNALSFRLFGGPIFYLVFQLIILLTIIIMKESDTMRSIPIPNPFKKMRGKTRGVNGSYKMFDLEDDGAELIDRDVAAEAARVGSATNGLRVRNLVKVFGSNTAVSDVTFGVRPGECLALLGPNGAGKTTTMNMIRGVLRPDSGNVYVEEVDANRHTAAARSHLGVCPQFDAIDAMTVEEHLTFYARARGVSDVPANVEHLIRAVGLQNFRGRMAAKLSGGNKRKLSLGIALMGNPSVLLLDEPSSGMDAASKRVMWKTISSVAPGRSILLTTHSMEEAHALATRHGIIARKMLAIGTTEHLREKVGNRYHVQVILSSAPHSSRDEMARLVEWVSETFSGAMIETTGHMSGGQLRFSVPAARGGINSLMGGLLRGKQEVGLEYFSLTQTGLEEMFMTVVTRNNVEEENSGEVRSRWWKFW